MKRTKVLALYTYSVITYYDVTSTYRADEARLLLRSLDGMAAGWRSVARPSRSTHSDRDRSLAVAELLVAVHGGGAATLSRRPPGNVDGGDGGISGCWPSRLSAPLRRDTSFIVADDRSPPSPADTPPPPTDDRRRHVREPVMNEYETRRGNYDDVF